METTNRREINSIGFMIIPFFHVNFSMLQHVKNCIRVHRTFPKNKKNKWKVSQGILFVLQLTDNGNLMYIAHEFFLLEENQNMYTIQVDEIIASKIIVGSGTLLYSLSQFFSAKHQRIAVIRR